MTPAAASLQCKVDNEDQIVIKVSVKVNIKPLTLQWPDGRFPRHFIVAVVLCVFFSDVIVDRFLNCYSHRSRNTIPHPLPPESSPGATKTSQRR